MLCSGLRRSLPGIIRLPPSTQLPIRNNFHSRVFYSTTGPLRRQNSKSNLSKHSQKESDISQPLKKDINIIVDTVALRTVPREAFALGLAGTLPYLATSLSTLYLGWDLQQTWAPGAKTMFMLTQQDVQQLVAFLEPVQLGYGAVIISFLGAIHWGMEFNERSPTKARTRFRYTMGVIAPAIAWPSLMMPFEYALMSQMTAFTLLYMADARAAVKQWAPAWYGSYRFGLTFVICAALVLSLIGRQKIWDSGPALATKESTMSLDDDKHKESGGTNKLPNEMEEKK